MKGLIRNPKNRDLLKIVKESRFISSGDLARIDGRRYQDVSEVLKELRRSKHLPIVSSAGRLPPSFLAPKTYVYGLGPRGHIIHWLCISHLRALFTDAARRLGVPLAWTQHRKHRASVPDARITLPGVSWTLEVDCSTERMGRNGIAGKAITPTTLIVAFKGEERFKNLSTLGGIATWHGYFHELEPGGFNILTEPCWWNGRAWISLVPPDNRDPTT